MLSDSKRGSTEAYARPLVEASPKPVKFKGVQPTTPAKNTAPLRANQVSTVLGAKLRSALTVMRRSDRYIIHWLGQPCGCIERRRKLSVLNRWAEDVLAGKVNAENDWLPGALDEHDKTP